MKYLLLAIIGYIVVSWLMGKHRTAKKPTPRQEEKNKPESIVQCAYCALHIPASEAITTESGVIFCCKEHQLQMNKPTA